MKAKMRLSLRQISAIIVLPLVMVACGRTEKNVQGDQSITLGTEVVQDNKFLYDGTMSTVLLRQFKFLDDGSVLQKNCSGTVITKNLVLTAAHCLVYPLDEADLYVEFPFTKDESNGIKVTKALFHEAYEPQKKLNDLMLVKLDREIPKDYLPMKIGKIQGYVPFGNLSLFGFGRSKSPNYADENDPGEDPKLRTVRVNLLARKDGFLRFDQRNGGSCMGDSGGPAVLKDGYQPLLVGVSSNVEANLTEAQNRELNGPRYNNDLVKYLKDNPRIEICKGFSNYVDLSLYEEWINDGIKELQ